MRAVGLLGAGGGRLMVPLRAKWNVSTAFLPPASLAAKLCVRTFSEPSPTARSLNRKLILYSKPGCCLCDNLKEKLQGVFLLGGQDSLSDVQLEVRDITTNADWEGAYQYEIPVLARVNEDDSETVLPRLSPRLSIELIHKKLSSALR
ncbi:hypothetical protein L7F22_020230 [Adiantum nelumboides]|nr:hypothetical protein [Adiantum nelumboides]